MTEKPVPRNNLSLHLNIKAGSRKINRKYLISTVVEIALWNDPQECMAMTKPYFLFYNNVSCNFQTSAVISHINYNMEIYLCCSQSVNKVGRRWECVLYRHHIKILNLLYTIFVNHLLVVYDGSICPNTGDCVKAETNKVFLLTEIHT